MAFDPNLPNDVKRSLRNNRQPQNLNNDWFGQATKALQEQTGSSSLGGGYVPMRSAAAPADNTPMPVAAPTRSAVPVNVATGSSSDPSTASLRPAGMRALPAGVVRSSIPGVYLARGKDGSFMASNVMGADGQPDFGGSSPTARSMGLRGHSNRNPGGTVVDPRIPITDMGGYTMAPGAQGGTFDPNAGVVDANGAGSLPGAVSGPRGGFTYAENSLHMNPSDMIKAAGINPEAAQQAKEQLIAGMNNDPNSENPEVAASNRAALAQLEGNVHDVRRQFYGGNGSMYGALGGAAVGGGRGLGVKDLLGLRQHQAQLAERTARDQATQQYRSQMADRADRSEARQGAQYFMTNYQNAENKLPGSGDTLIAQTTPQGLSPSDFKKWVTTNPAGQAWSQALLQSMQRGAAESLKTPFGIPAEWGDRANLASNVNFGNMKLDKNGNFAGFFDSSDNPTNEYPRKSGFWGSPNYDESLLRTISPSYWKVLQQIGLRRSQPASSE